MHQLLETNYPMPAELGSTVPPVLLLTTSTDHEPCVHASLDASLRGVNSTTLFLQAVLRIVAAFEPQ